MYAESKWPVRAQYHHQMIMDQLHNEMDSRDPEGPRISGLSLERTFPITEKHRLLGTENEMDTLQIYSHHGRVQWLIHQ